VDNEKVTISELRIEEFMGIRLVELQLPAAGVTTLGGWNRAGKSSALTAISVLFRGAKMLPTDPVHHGADKSVIRAILSNGDVATCTIQPDGNYRVTLKDAGGRPYNKPGEILKRLVSNIAFDPGEFARLSKTPEGRRQQVATLRELLGLDFTEIDADRQEAYDARAVVNRELKSLEVQLHAMPHHKDAPEAEVAFANLAERMTEATQHNAVLERANRDLKTIQAIILQHTEEIARLKLAIEGNLAKAKTVTDWLADNAPIDIEAITNELATAEQTNAKVRQNQARANLHARWKAAVAESDRHTEAIEAADAAKAKLLADATMPVEGLTFDSESVRYNGTPLDGCSGEERLTVSMAIAEAMNPGLRVILIDEGGAYDEHELAKLCETAIARGLHVLMTVPRCGPDVSFVIQNGELASPGAD
jgi:hypothetical protein